MSDLILRPPTEADIPALHGILSRPKVQWGTGRLPFETEDYIAARIRKPEEGTHTILAEKDGRVVGYCALMQGKRRRAHSGSLAITVHDDFHRQGIGRALMAAITDLADNWLGLTRLELTVNTDNAGAIALYRAFGFEEEGVSRADILRGGVYIDSLHMGRLVAPRPRA